jgi:aspartate 1-decarboxylase
MFRKALRAKIHRATVTHANVDYEGSLTIPADLMKLADMVNYEAISVWNVTTGSRFETYAITGEKGSTDICVNGAAAHLASPGDKIIIASFADFSEEELSSLKPILVFLDQDNKPKKIENEIPGPSLRKVGF